MLLGVDVGNSRTKCICFDDHGVIAARQTELTDKSHPDQLVSLIRPLAANADDVCIASVVPEVNAALRGLGQHGRALFVSDAVRLPFSVRYEPGRLGADRIAAACGAHELRPGRDCLVFDIGTALTMGVLLREEVFDGGLILAGPSTAIRALDAQASQLWEATLEPIEHPVARSTRDALRAGFFFGYAAMIEGLAARVERYYGRQFEILLTGGGAAVLSQGIARTHAVEPDLVVFGLRCIHRMNRGCD